MALAEIESNGLAKGVAVELLSTPNVFAANSTITLADDITNYDSVEFIFAFNDSGTSGVWCHWHNAIFSKGMIETMLDNASSTPDFVIGRDCLGMSYYVSSTYFNQWGIRVNPSNTKEITCGSKNVGSWATANWYLYKVIGYK